MPDPFGDRVERIHADGRSVELEWFLAGRTFDAVVDFAAYEEDAARRAVAALAGRTGHYMFISSGQIHYPFPALAGREIDAAEVGHRADLTTTMRYAHVEAHELKSGIANLERFVSSQAPEEPPPNSGARRIAVL